MQHEEEIPMRVMYYAIYLILLIALVPAYGQFYRYVDEKGVVRFTDDLDKIPKNQRPESKMYDESKSKEDVQETSRAEASDSSADDKASLADIKKKTRELEIKRKQLDAEYKTLMEKKAVVQQMNKKTRVELIKYNQEVLKINEEIQAYEQKRQAFDSEVEAFNKSIMEKEEQRLKSGNK
jgi:chromosome segregation ATPase